MDIKKPNSSLFRGAPPSISKQTSTSQQPANSQPSLKGFKLEHISQIKVGQQLDLLVLKLTATEALLEIMGSQLRIHTKDVERLTIGQQLKALVSSTEPTFQLKILNQPSHSQAIINTRLRQIIPMQQPLKNLLDNIQLLTSTNKKNSLPALTKAASRFMQSLPPMEAYQEVDILPAILTKSGIFTEYLLAQQIDNEHKQPSFPNNDLKIALLRLAHKLKALQSDTTNHAPKKVETTKVTAKSFEQFDVNQSPNVQLKQNILYKTPTNQETKIAELHQATFIDKLINQTEGVLAKLQTLQLQHAQPDEQNKSTWSFDLPIRTNSALDNLQIYIEQNTENAKNKNHITPWKIILKFNIKELGLIQAHITLQANKVSVDFWTEDKQTSQLFSEHLNILSSQLDKSGLESGRLHCHCDKPPKQQTSIYKSLIDEIT